ncbi:Ecdysteroid 22-kinase [Operophtera brumata]|uniref:Ecdysteroid 22-kinase n=1 Tax=Operophtera brumata TaxID=104452 RepID=A0A0L7L0L9_OPEBR|nr:Ecdysteroid 22-kinase [Operophtera brumata]
MAGLKIEGNLDNIGDKQLGYIKDVIEKHGFTDAKVVIEPVGQAGDNYMANVKRIIIQETDGSILRMIAKLAPNQEAHREMTHTKVLFRNEHLMYTKVLPKFEQVQRAADIPKEERLRFAACYGSFEEAPHEFLAGALSVLESDIHKKIVKDVITFTLPTFAKMLRADRESKHLIIQQGNLLESIMIDYQGSKASNPVADIQYMIFNCTDYKSRKEHFHDWIDYYHTELDKSLSSFGLKANYVYPKDQLDADLKRYGKISLGLSVVLSSMLILKPEDAMKMKEAMESADMNEMSKNTDIGRLGADSIALFKSRVEGLIDSFIEFGFVKV